MSVKANCMMAWRLFAGEGDLQELAEPRLQLHKYNYQTRAAAAGVLTQENKFTNFVKKGATIYNILGSNISGAKNKVQAKLRIKKEYKRLDEALDNLAQRCQ